MCYSAQLINAYEAFVKHHGAIILIEEFAALYGFKCQNDRIKVPRAVELTFNGEGSEFAARIQASLMEYRQQQTTKLEQELFEQRKRLADAERKLLTKATKAATESKRIATNKVTRGLEKLAALASSELTTMDSRIFPGYYAPVLVMENGRKVVRTMRYLCRPEGKPADYDIKYPGTYNARMDSLEGYWKEQFGYTHGVIAVSAFYEHVKRPSSDGQLENTILEFNPRPQQVMLLACLWSHWTAPGEPDLLSFAAITTEPPPEVAAAGHDRCVIPIKPENVDAWLDTDHSTIEDLYAILEDRERPYYEHRIAA